MIFRSLDKKCLNRSSLIEATENYHLYGVVIENVNYKVYLINRRATRATRINLLESGDIEWVQYYPFGGMSRPNRMSKIALKPKQDDGKTIVVIKGKPQLIYGLDEGMFLSAQNIDMDGVAVLSVKEYKNLF